ncbi:MAG: hypothetical protein ACOC1P_00480 [Minisyncoccales bacterium]
MFSWLKYKPIFKIIDLSGDKENVYFFQSGNSYLEEELSVKDVRGSIPVIIVPDYFIYFEKNTPVSNKIKESINSAYMEAENLYPSIDLKKKIVCFNGYIYVFYCKKSVLGYIKDRGTDLNCLYFLTSKNFLKNNILSADSNMLRSKNIKSLFFTSNDIQDQEIGSFDFKLAHSMAAAFTLSLIFIFLAFSVDYFRLSKNEKNLSAAINNVYKKHLPEYSGNDRYGMLLYKLSQVENSKNFSVYDELNKIDKAFEGKIDFSSFVFDKKGITLTGASSDSLSVDEFVERVNNNSDFYNLRSSNVVDNKIKFIIDKNI